jgi:hypothetical protein
LNRTGCGWHVTASGEHNRLSANYQPPALGDLVKSQPLGEEYDRGVLTWATILYGAFLSALAAALIVVALRRDRRFDVIAAAALSGAAGPLLWNGILHRVGGSEFFVDAPVAVLPASWQDTGSGVFAAAVATLVLGFGPASAETGRRLALLALACGVGAFLVDVYLY